MKKLGMIAAVAMVALAASSAMAAGTATFYATESSAGVWDISVSVSGDTQGLAGFNINVTDVSPTGVAWTQNTLSTFSMTDYKTHGFITSGSGVVGGTYFSAYAAQDTGTTAPRIYGVGMDSINVAGVPAPVVLDPVAALGSFTLSGTPSFAFSATLYKTDLSGVLLPADTTINSVVTPLEVPEPATMAMLGLGGIAALIRRRRRA